MSKFKQANYFLFELWLFFRALPFGLTTIAVTMLVQDKICLHNYHQSVEYCQNISKAMEAVSDKHVRDHILADSAQFSNYKNLIECIPMVLWSLFAGSFLDKYTGGTRLMLIIGILGDFVGIGLNLTNIYFFDWNPYLVLIPSLAFWLTGGMANFFTVTYRYIVITTTEKIRPIKFMLFSFAVFMGLSIGSLIAGQVLFPRTPNSAFHQIRTYHYNFILTILAEIIAFGLIFTLEPANKQKEEPKESSEISCETDEENSVYNNETDGNLDQNHNQTNYETISQTIRSQSEDIIELLNPEEDSQNKNFLLILFDFKNVKETIVCFLKSRSGHTRLQIYLCTSILIAYILVFFGSAAVMFQFCEKVYNYDAKEYSNNSFLVNLMQTVFMTFATILLIKRWKFQDETLLMMAIVSNFGQQLILGTVLKPMAYFVGQFIGSFGGFTPIAIRNKISKIIPSDEVGKIFSVLSTIEATMPFFGSLIFTNLFSVSISSYTGLIFQFSAGIMVVALATVVFQELYCKKSNSSLDNA